MKKISVIVPMYNEEEVAKECYNRLTSVLNSIENYEYEILIVDDGSKDKTLDILKEIASNDSKIKILSFSRNFGHEAATECGLNHSTGDVIVIIDADLQDPPELIPDMLKYWEEGYKVVYGRRNKREGENVIKLLTAKMFYKVLNQMADVTIPKDTGDFRLIDKKVVEDINNMPEQGKFMRGLISWCGYSQKEYRYDRKERFAGKTKYPLKKLFKLSKDAIFGFSSKPIKVVGKLGVLSIFISIIILIYSFVSYFTGRAIEPGWTSIMVTVTFFAGMQLVCLRIIAEYIGRIYDNSKQRPNYLIDEKYNI